ncbi:hypothetical protein Tco_0088719 [Tanacetum coccineum]
MNQTFSYYASHTGGGDVVLEDGTLVVEVKQEGGGRGAGRFGKGREGEEGVEMMVGEQAELAEVREGQKGYLTLHLFINTLREMIKDEIRDNMEHEYMEQLLIKEEEKRAVEDKAR